MDLSSLQWSIYSVFLFMRSSNSAGIFAYKCGGVLISDRYVLTVAHCAKTRKRGDIVVRSVRVGNGDEDGCVPSKQLCPQTTEIASVILHPNFTDPGFDNDIALLRLKERNTINEKVSPVCLPINDNSEDITGKTVVTSSLVQNSYFEKTNNVRNSEAVVMALEECLKDCKNSTQSINSNVICTSNLKDNSRVLEGTALIKKSVDKDVWEMVGVKAFDKKDCRSAVLTNGYSSIIPHLKWILDNITE